MLFNSIEFFVYFAIVYALYRALPFRGQNAMLLLAGYVFYGWWDVRFLFLIAFSTVVDFNIGLMLGAGRVPLKQRLTSSLFLVGSAFAFLCVNPTAIHWSNITVDQATLLVPWSHYGFATLAGTIGLVGVANALHGAIARMDDAPRRKLLMVLTVAVNLGFLGFFKYFNFFIASAEAAIASLGWNPATFRLHIVLPVGISFYTFQSLSYTIDAYRGLVRPTSRFWEFALFVAYFPPMVAGPIERGRHLLPQLQKPRRIRWERSMSGVVLILYGLFKKVAIADGVAPAVDAVFNATGPVGFTDVAIATVLFAVQIFCDFSGYSDIAIGVSRLLGIELMTNFRLPYFSKDPSEFWRRWHISLSSWLRDYLYIPLGGNRKGPIRTYVNLMTTMVLGGLWHGAAWNYVLWGAYQGALLCGHRLIGGFRSRRPLPSGAEVIHDTKHPAHGTHHAVGHGPTHPPDPPREPLAARALRGASVIFAMGFFFLFVCYGWLLFRASSAGQIATFTKTLVGLGPTGVPTLLPRLELPALLGIPLLLLLQVIEYRDDRGDFLLRQPRPLQGAIYAAMIVTLLMGTSNAPVQFIYFQF